MQTLTPEAETRPSRAALVAAAGGLLATLLTGAACVGPLVAILLGIGGFGWLTQYGYLRVPASLATAALLAAGFYLVHRKRRRCGAARARRETAVLWLATAVAVAINLFEYVIFPRLG